MFKRRVFAGLLLSILLLLSGCLTVGEEFPTSVRWIEIGKTQRQDIQTRIGEPFRTGYDSGRMTYTYAFYRYSLFRPARTKDLTIRFNNDGTVHSYTFASSFNEDKQNIAREAQSTAR